MSINQPKGKLVGYNQLKQGKTLLKLQDGNYLEISINIHKVLKAEGVNQFGEPLYMVATSFSTTFYKSTELAQLEESQEKY